MLREKTFRETAVRVGTMSRDELRTRLRQEIAKRQDAIGFRIGLASVSRELQASNGRARRQSSAARPLSLAPGRFLSDARDSDSTLRAMRQPSPREVGRSIGEATPICGQQIGR